MDGWIMAMSTVNPNSSLLFFRSQSSSSPPKIVTPVLPTYEKQFRRKRGSLVVTRGGAPGATTYLFAFLFPLSLLAVTIFTSINISDKLDRDYYEELEVNQSILEAQDYDDDDANDDDDVDTPIEKEPTPSRTRNRPKRQLEEVSGN